MRLFRTLQTGWQLAALVFRRGMEARRPLTEAELESIKNEWQSAAERPQLARAIGNIAIGWARVEILYDYANAFIISRPTCEETTLPIPLKPKLAFFRKHFETMPELSPFREQAESLLARTNKLKVVRHDVVHGIAGKRLPNGIRSIQRIEYRGKRLGEYRTDYTLRQIVDAAEAIAELASDMTAFLSAVIVEVRSDSERSEPDGNDDNRGDHTKQRRG